MNPAFAGYNGFITVNELSRFQTTFLKYQTHNMSYDQAIGKINGGFGINLQYDIVERNVVKTKNADLIHSQSFLQFNKSVNIGKMEKYRKGVELNCF